MEFQNFISMCLSVFFPLLDTDEPFNLRTWMTFQAKVFVSNYFSCFFLVPFSSHSSYLFSTVFFYPFLLLYILWDSAWLVQSLSTFGLLSNHSIFFSIMLLFHRHPSILNEGTLPLISPKIQYFKDLFLYILSSLLLLETEDRFSLEKNTFVLFTH